MFTIKTIEIDVYDENISQIGLLLAEACVWISKLIKVMFTLCKTRRIVTYKCILTATLMLRLRQIWDMIWSLQKLAVWFWSNLIGQ